MVSKTRAHALVRNQNLHQRSTKSLVEVFADGGFRLLLQQTSGKKGQADSK
jgi:hypothetical protein